MSPTRQGAAAILGRRPGARLFLAALLAARFSSTAALWDQELCDDASSAATDGACASGLSLLQTGQRRVAARGAQGGMADLGVAVAEAVAKGGAEGDGEPKHRVKPEWSEALLQRSSRTSFSSSLERAVSSKLFGGDDSATEAVRGAQQLAKVVGNSTSGEVESRVDGAAKGNCTVPSKHDSFDNYLNCLSDHCEDGASELSGGVSCSIMMSSGCGTDLHSLHDSVPAGIFVGRLCASSCGWCGDDPRALAAKAAAAGAAEMLAATAEGASGGMVEKMEAVGASAALMANGAQYGRVDR